MPGKARLRHTPFLSLLRFSLGIDVEFVPTLTPEEWQRVYVEAVRQSVVGVLYKGIERLPSAQWPPTELAMKWMGEAETIRTMNVIVNDEARQTTRFFSEAGRQTAILKGPANARLYPDPQSRQVGDIDIWVEGGQERVLALLKENGLLDTHYPLQYHHARLLPSEHGVAVEAHYRPSSYGNGCVQDFLERELQESPPTLCPEGFYVPSLRFALVMQLAHIRSHLLGGGVGLRQLIDYYLLLQNSTAEDRRDVAGRLKEMGLWHTAEALMWMLGQMFDLDGEHTFVSPHRWRGEWVMKQVTEKGNFGHHTDDYKIGTLRFFLRKRWRVVEQIRFEPERSGALLRSELRYWKNVFLRIPLRIKYRSLSLRFHPEIIN